MERRLAGFVSRGNAALSAAVGPQAGEAGGGESGPGEDAR